MFGEPDLDGPDYVALVIEWQGPVDEIDDQVTTPHMAPTRWQRLVHELSGARVATAFGALGAIALVGYGIHRLRA